MLLKIIRYITHTALDELSFVFFLESIFMKKIWFSVNSKGSYFTIFLLRLGGLTPVGLAVRSFFLFLSQGGLVGMGLSEMPMLS